MEDMLNEDTHYDEICGYLASMSKEDIIKLGVTLGLNVTRLEGDDGDMVSDWLKMQDNVMIETGEPTWSTLVEALEKIGQIDVATSIKKSKEDNVVTATIKKGAKSGDANPAGGTCVINQQSQREEDDRTQSDMSWPFKKSKKELQLDRLEFDSSVKISGQHFPAKNRGQHKAYLKLEDNNNDTTTITPRSATQKPYSYLGYYPMKSEKHGVAMIINNKMFVKKKHGTRTGTDRDEDNLIETWQYLGYHVVVFKDCKRDTMAQLFLNIDEAILNDVRDVEHDSFVTCILSHGKEGVVFGSDSKPLEHNHIQRFLAKSEKLRGKPKMIFFQACQGESLGAKAMEDKLPDIATDDDRISEYTDFYLSCASVAGDRSYRDIFTGTWFISELCQTLCEFSTVMDLDEIQKKVNAKVVQNYTYTGMEKKKTDTGEKIKVKVDYKQQPRGIDQLRFKVFYFDA